MNKILTVDKPQPVSQQEEWSPRDVQAICEKGFADDLTPEQSKVIADAHSAELAAERKQWEATRDELQRIIEGNVQQLAAERETSRYWKEQWVERGAQLAAEREALKMVTQQREDYWDKIERYEAALQEIANETAPDDDAQEDAPTIGALKAQSALVEMEWKNETRNSSSSTS